MIDFMMGLFSARRNRSENEKDKAFSEGKSEGEEWLIDLFGSAPTIPHHTLQACIECLFHQYPQPLNNPFAD